MTLDASGPGSLRAALESPQPRLIVFEVGGVIDLAGHSLTIRDPFAHIAGQTAPDPGITIIRGSLTVETHDVIIEHIAVRPGDRGPEAADAIGVRRGAAPAYNVVFDHCSATWAIDENLSASGPADVDGSDIDATSHDITLRHCLIAEGLSHAGHPKGEHSKGTLIHDGVRNVTIDGCLYAHNRERNPRLKGGTKTIVTNNVMYDWGSACVGVGARGNKKMLSPAEVVLTNNFAIAGPDTRSKVFVKSVDPGARVSMRDNVAVDANGAALPLADDGVVPWTTGASPVAPLDRRGRLSSTGTLISVLRSAGARPAHRDPIDARIVQSVIDGSGHIIDSQGEYPTRAATKRALVVPEKNRQQWLDKLSNDLCEDKSLDVAPLLKRLHLLSPRA